MVARKYLPFLYRHKQVTLHSNILKTKYLTESVVLKM